MKTTEFIKEVEALGYRADTIEMFTAVEDGGLYLCLVSEKNRYECDTILGAFGNTDKITKSKLFNLVTEYAVTPIEERKDEKKYRYKVSHNLRINKDGVLHISKDYDDEISLDGSSEKHVIEHSSFHFTDKEVEQYTNKDRALFEACEKIEITEKTK